MSEARGWLARVHLLLGDQAAAGKIYLDELNRDGSNLSEETVRDSLQITYGHDGGQKLRDQLEEYFDTPQHAAFAIQLATNPSWNRYERDDEPRPDTQALYQRMQALLEKHSGLLKSEDGANALAMLSMRTALRMGDPPGALTVARMIPGSSPLRIDPDFHWMLASAYFLSHQFAAAEKPLLALFRSARATPTQRAAAAYGLCGVYQKTKNLVEQVHFALWLWHANASGGWKDPYSDVHWAASGWDAGLLLDTEASDEDLMAFLDKYPADPETRIVKYSLAVRLTRENRYEEAAQIYESIRARVRAPRTRHLADLYAEANRKGLPIGEAQEAKYRLAEFIAGNANRIYFNDALWSGLQRYAMDAERESGFAKEEREAALLAERRLKDEQEEYWRAYLILRDVVRDAGNSEVGREAAVLALRCLRRISSERFGRQEEIRRADVELSSQLRAWRNSGVTQGSAKVE